MKTIVTIVFEMRSGKRYCQLIGGYITATLQTTEAIPRIFTINTRLFIVAIKLLESIYEAYHYPCRISRVQRHKYSFPSAFNISTNNEENSFHTETDTLRFYKLTSYL